MENAQNAVNQLVAIVDVFVKISNDVITNRETTQNTFHSILGIFNNICGIFCNELLTWTK